MCSKTNLQVERRQILQEIKIDNVDYRRISQLPDPHRAFREIFPETHTSVAIDKKGTKVMDDSIFYDRQSNIIYVHTADLTTVFGADAQSQVECLSQIVSVINRTNPNDKKDPLKLFKKLRRDVLSLGARTKYVCAVTIELHPTFTIEQCERGKKFSTHPFEADVYLSMIRRPKLITNEEASKLMCENSSDVGKMLRDLSTILKSVDHMCKTNSGEKLVESCMKMACIYFGKVLAPFQMRFSRCNLSDGTHIQFLYRAHANSNGKKKVIFTTDPLAIHETIKVSKYLRMTSPLRHVADCQNHLQLGILLTQLYRIYGAVRLVFRIRSLKILEIGSDISSESGSEASFLQESDVGTAI